MCVFIFSRLFFIHVLFLDMIKNVCWSSCKVSKNTKISNFTKIRLVGAEVFHVDRRTDMTKLMVAFHNYAIAYKNNRMLKLALLSVA
jgi:hypothetical protein